jgi:hypothetical protein
VPVTTGPAEVHPERLAQPLGIVRLQPEMLLEPGIDPVIGHVIDRHPVRFPVREGGQDAFF